MYNKCSKLCSYFKVLIDNVIRARIQFPILFPKNVFYMHISNLMEIQFNFRFLFYKVGEDEKKLASCETLAGKVSHHSENSFTHLLAYIHSKVASRNSVVCGNSSLTRFGIIAFALKWRRRKSSIIQCIKMQVTSTNHIQVLPIPLSLSPSLTHSHTHMFMHIQY